MDRYNFEEMHIALVWKELKERFGFNIPAWKEDFDRYYTNRPRNISTEDAFLMYGSAFINDLLNKILMRNAGYPTFNRLCRYVATGKTHK